MAIGLNSLLDENASGRLSKSYNVYAGTKVKTEYKTYSSATAGADCLKTTYIYTGTQITGLYSEVAIWTQPMEDATKGSVATFTNTYSVDFDGINDHVNIGNAHNYDASDAFSVAFYIKPQNTAAQRGLFSKVTNDANVHGYVMYHNSSGNLFLQMRAPGTNRSHTFTGSTLIPSVWQLVVFTYAGGSNINGARSYINSVVGTTPSSGSLAGYLSGQDFTLGSRNTAFNFSGLIDEVTVWDKTLSQIEVTELYNAGTVLDPTGHSAAANLQSWYRMGDGDVFPTLSDNQNGADGTMTNMGSEDIVEDAP